jgi:hypothetical protein
VTLPFGASDGPGRLPTWRDMHCGLVRGGVPDEITAGQAGRILDQLRPAGPAAGARGELAAELLAGLRHLDTQWREAKARLAAAVKASCTSLTGGSSVSAR